MERTEELGLAARLPIVVGGQPVELRILNLDESEKWQEQFEQFDVSFDTPAEAKRTTAAMLELVTAYDIDGALGVDLRKRFSRGELYAAFKQMTRAEMPFLEDAPSAAQVFGEMLASRLVVGQFQSASSTNGRSPTGAAIRKTSASGSRRKGS